MSISFNSLLVPVDMTPHSGLAITRASSLAADNNAVLHLLYAGRSWLPFRNENEMATAWLKDWKRRIAEKYPSLWVFTHTRTRFLDGYVRTVARAARNIEPDLIISNTFHEDLAQKAKCPVLTIGPAIDSTKTKLIVIPISHSVCDQNLEWGITLARKYKARIHLLAIREDEDMAQGALLKAYHHLRENLGHPVDFSTSYLHDPGKAALIYAEKIDADLILLDPQLTDN